MEHRTEMCDSISWGRFEPLQSQFTDRVSGKSAALLKHFNPLHLFPERQTADDSCSGGQPFPLLSYIFPPSCRHMSILCQRIRDASYCSAAWEWCQLSYRALFFLWDVDGKAADNSCKDANTSHHLQNYFPALQLCQVVPWRVIEGGKKKKKNDVIFPTGL